MEYIRNISRIRTLCAIYAIWRVRAMLVIGVQNRDDTVSHSSLKIQARQNSHQHRILVTTIPTHEGEVPDARPRLETVVTHAQHAPEDSGGPSGAQNSQTWACADPGQPSPCAF